ncbi:MAG: tyrosine-type recombinase/integrase, partial [Pseudomonadota bacterium]
PRVTIKSAFEDWIKDQDQKHDTSRKWRVYIERFIDVHGDLVLAEITPDHVRAYIRKIASLPDCRGLKIDRVPELLAYKAKHPDKQLVSPSTVAKHLDGLKALFRWAVSQGLVDSNPASSFRPPKDNRPVSSERRPFTTAELKKVLDAAKREWRDKGGEYGTDRWWILQLGIYSGARLEEICQLSKENVYQDGDTWVMRIDDDDERQVKNKTSNRTVPLHKKLVDAGFPAFVGKAKGPRIFDLEKTVGRYGNRVSKSFARLVRDQNKASIPDPKKNLVFHSIRHSFTDACRHAGVPLDICQVLLGHSAGTITSNYGAGHDVSTLKSWIDKVDPLK